MKPARGDLLSQHVIVTHPKDVGRLYQKSDLGKILSNNSLQLAFIEAAFLIEEQKLNVFYEGEKILFDEMITYAAQIDQFFEEKYVVFRDLRKRGIQAQLSKDSDLTFTYEKKDEQTQMSSNYIIIVFSEREIPSLFQLKELVQHAIKNKSTLWLGVVDEEGDITYYALEIIVLEGTNIPHSYQPIMGLMLSNRVIVFDEKINKQLHMKEFFGKPFGEGLQLSLVEALYLNKKEILKCTLPTNSKPLSKKAFMDEILTHQQDIKLRYHVFYDLKQKGLIVKTGFKFGTHFRAYQNSPFHSHAEFLIHTIDTSYQTQWPEISRAIRLAHAVNKYFVFALIGDKMKKPEYMIITRIRP